MWDAVSNNMIRKTLTTLSLIGLLLSVGAWGVSYFWVYYSPAKPTITVSLCVGNVQVVRGSTSQRGLYSLGYRGLATNWTGKIIDHSSGTKRTRHLFYRNGVLIPLWIPTLAFGVLALSLPLHRRRKRKKLGLCLKCGYDLRASKNRYPECGEEFGSTGVARRG